MPQPSNFLRQFFTRYKNTLNLIRDSISIKTDVQRKNFLIERFAIQLVALWLLDSIGAWKANLITNFKRLIEENANYYSDFILPLLKTLKNEQFLLVTTEELDLIEAQNELFYNINSHNLDNGRLPIFRLLESYKWSIDEKNTEKRVEVLTPYVLSYLYEMSISRGTTGTVYTPPSIADYITKTALQKLSKNVNNKNKLPAELVVLDPAMGTGNFILSALFILEEYYTKTKKQESNKVELVSVRKAIVANQLYGIDLDPYAVKICILRLFFALLAAKLKNKSIDLANIPFTTNFFVGDTLTTLNTNPLKTKKWDIILMNPPYVRAKEIPTTKKKLYKKYFRTAYGAFDLSILFIELALKTLNENGVLGCIASNKWLIADFGKKLRKEIVEKYSITEIVDCSDAELFDDVQIATVITFIENKAKSDVVLVKKLQSKDEQQLQFVRSSYIRTSEIKSEDDNYRIHLLDREVVNQILEQIERFSVKLENMADVRTGVMGFKYWSMSDYVSEKAITPTHLKLLNNSLIGQYSTMWGSKSVKLYGKTYSKLYLDISCPSMTASTRNFFKKQKIVVRGIGKKTTAYADTEGVALSVAVHGIIPNSSNISLYYLTAILNSPIIDWYHKTKWYTARIPQGSLRYPVAFWKTIPIKTGKYMDIIDKLSKILHHLLKEKHRTLAYEVRKLIDGLIYDIYLDISDCSSEALEKNMLEKFKTFNMSNLSSLKQLLKDKTVKRFIEKIYSNALVKNMLQKN
ncbi:MAG: Eco57I restriction-modification methylase domain-containing protein [Candidatus Heimdallarchaeaceae archaeon]